MSAVCFLIFSLQVLGLVSASHLQCDDIFPPQHGQLRFDRYYLSYQVTCEPGYTLHGESRVYCTNGQWSSPPPSCFIDSSIDSGEICEKLEALENGQVNCDEEPLSVGKKCYFQCNEGYQRRGVRMRLCMSGLKWSGLSPTCISTQSTFCLPPPLLIHGTVVGCSPTKYPRVGESCSYRCKEGYELQGPSKVTCRSTGKYTDSVGSEVYPECVEISPSDQNEGVVISEHDTRNSNFGSRNYYGSNAIKRDPCENNTCEQICKVEKGRAQCRCDKGYILNKENQRTCDVNNGPPIHTTKRPRPTYNRPKNPCYHNNGGCAQLCSLTKQREVFCSCRSGFVLEADGRSCTESSGQPLFNPCLENNGGCDHHCSITTSNELICYCRPGYILENDQRSCVWDTGSKFVTKSSISTLRPITRSPISISGFASRVPEASVVRQPAPVDPCSFNNGGCHHKCQVTENSSVECSCYEGFQLYSDGRRCFDINECLRPDLNNCEQKCLNIQGSFRCVCEPGFDLIDGYKCQDIDECSIELLNKCHHFCTNTEGSFTCHCKPGYILTDGYKCEGCGKNKFWSFELGGCVDCPPNSHSLSEGSQSISNCLCDAGFTGSPGDDIPCYDIDECSSDNFGCSDICTNIPGEAYCSCPHGFMLDTDNKTCIDVDECKIKNGGCEGVCINEHGSFHCICPEGYKKSNKDQYSCDDVDECEKDNGGCEHKCVNYRGGYHCTCENGYRLDSERKNCTEVKCSALPVPPHSKMTCKYKKQKLQEMDTYQISAVCNFTCDKGFKNIQHLNIMECQEDGTWSGTLPQCKPQRCQPLEVPENGAVHPSFCSNSGNKVKQRCTFSCHPGYEIKGLSIFQCKNDLTWDVKDIPVCNPEKTQPRIECPEDVVEILLKGKKTHLVTLSEPTTNMESYEIRPKRIPVGSAFEFQAGVTKVTFVAISPLSNKSARCVTTVTILDKEPPKFEYCPDAIEIQNASADGAFVTWEEPVVTDNVEVETLYSIMEPNTTLAPGTHVAEYIARDTAGNTATCSFDITITRMKCPVLENPKHGKANCVDWFDGKFCQPQCDAGYMRNPDDPEYYSCDDTGVWEPTEVISECLNIIEDDLEDQLPAILPVDNGMSTSTRDMREDTKKPGPTYMIHEDEDGDVDMAPDGARALISGLSKTAREDQLLALLKTPVVAQKSSTVVVPTRVVIESLFNQDDS